MSNENAERDYAQLVSSIEQTRLDERSFAIRKAIATKSTVRRNRRRGALAVAVASILTGASILAYRAVTAPNGAPASADVPSKTIAAIEQGPTVEALTPGTLFRSEETQTQYTYRLESGILRFESGENDKKALVVRVGELIIEDIGTVFTVETRPENRARVNVFQGTVRVTWTEGVETLDAGMNGVYPPLPTENVSLSKDENRRKPNGASHFENWRILARGGEYEQAFAIIDNHPEKVKNRADDLLLAADIMRLTGRPSRAVSYLQAVVRKHADDPRAGLAAFTLGRVFLDELGQPLAAAKAFMTARKTQGPLAEKALAREVEAWSRAGEMNRARQAAKQYLRQYPAGDRESTVRAFGGVDDP